MSPQSLTAYHAKYYAYELTRRCPPDSEDRLAAALVDAQVDLNLTIKKIPKAVLSRCDGVATTTASKLPTSGRRRRSRASKVWGSRISLTEWSSIAEQFPDPDLVSPKHDDCATFEVFAERRQIVDECFRLFVGPSR